MQFVLLMIRFIFRMASVFCKFILNDTQRCYTSSSWPKRIYTTVYHILNLHISQTSQLTIYLFRQPHKLIIRLNWLIFQLFLGVDIACKFAKYLLSSQLYQICYYPNCLCTYVAFFLLIQGHVKMAVQILRISSTILKQQGKGYFSGCLAEPEKI